jgi:hypothetical protein
MSENVGASTSRNPKGLHGLYGDNFTFTQSEIRLLPKLDAMKTRAIIVFVFIVRLLVRYHICPI